MIRFVVAALICGAFLYQVAPAMLSSGARDASAIVVAQGCNPQIRPCQ